MIDREKQIEEMEKLILEAERYHRRTLCLNTVVETRLVCVCDWLYNAGYRKMDEVTLKLDLGDRSVEEIQQIAEAFNKAVKNEQTLVTVSNNEEEIAKRVAKEIYKRVDEFRKSPELDPRDSYDCNALNAYNNVCKFINRKYGVEIDK